jgi:hypothetical protein
MGKPWENHRKTIGNWDLASGKLPHNYGKSPFFDG